MYFSLKGISGTWRVKQPELLALPHTLYKDPPQAHACLLQLIFRVSVVSFRMSHSVLFIAVKYFP